MGERKGVNKYYPPDFDYKKHGSLDRYHNSHPLRERAKKISEGILIIRFEMPYNIWCNGCNKHIGMGVRYNSEKKRVGYYYTTPIYKFRMKCHLCEQYFEIQTDPANCEYVILSGARRKEERWDAKDNEQIELTDHAVKKKLISDPMYKLEHGSTDKKKLDKVIPTLSEIQDLQEEKRDDYLLNKALRKNFRDEKKAIEESNKADQSLLKKASLSIKLLPESEADRNLSKLLQLKTVKTPEEKQKVARKDIQNKPVLKPSSSIEDSVNKLNHNIPPSIKQALATSTVNSSLWDSTVSNNSSKKNNAINKLGIVRKRKCSRNNLDDAVLPPAKVRSIDKTAAKPFKLTDVDIDKRNGINEHKDVEINTIIRNNKVNLSLVSYDTDSGSDSTV